VKLGHYTTALVFVAASAGAAQAEPAAFKFDKGHADISFSVSHLGYSMVRGGFREFDGELTLDRADPSASKVSATIYTYSVDTGLEARDRHLRTADFFNVVKFPTMTFVSNTVKPAGRDKNKAEIAGDLTLLGVTKPVTLSVTLNKLDPNPRTNAMTAGFTATGKIKRSDFGMSFGVPGLGDEIQITINIEATEAATKAQ
jgi:polyisoprenoid-binding protein YceI